MKFGKRLQSQLEETLPEWRDKYLSYKQLKKRLKLISAAESFVVAGAVVSEPLSTSNLNGGERESKRMRVESAESLDLLPEAFAPDALIAATTSSDSSVNGLETVTEEVGRKLSSGSVVLDPDLPKLIGATDLRNMTAEEVDFIHLLDAELEKFNSFFIEKEEEYVIRLQELKERIERMKEQGGNGEDSSEDVNEEMIDIRKDIVNFHGEMVLLENYSSLNYTGLVKILKKHDKRTGALLRMPFIQNVLHQPFFTTELLSKLVRECEMNLHSLFPSASSNGGRVLDVRCACNRSSSGPTEGPRNVFVSQKADTADVETIYRSTVAALRTIKDLRKGSSTYNVFSLPPFSRGDSDFEDGAGNTNFCCATIPVCTKQ